MSDLELLFLILALIYLWECASWVPTGSMAFASRLPPPWHHRRPLSVLGNQNGGLAFGYVLPPLDPIVLSHPLRIDLTDGILRSDPSRPSVKSWPLGEIKKVDVEGKKLLINNETFLRCASPTLALEFSRLIQQLINAPEPARKNLLEDYLKQRFDTKAIEGRWKDFESRTRILRFLANVLFLYLFALAPLVIWRTGLVRSWPFLVAALYALTFSIAFLFRRIHKRFYPAAGNDRFTHVLTNMFSPASTIRVFDVLSRPLLETFHPLAIAKVFCPEAEFKELARQAMLDIRYPANQRASTATVQPAPGEPWLQAKETALLEKFLQSQKLKLTELLAAPERTDLSSQSYCPRCHAQFTFSTGVCADCGGLPVIPFDTGKKQVAATSRTEYR
jgi:hypothetical protein